MPDMETTDRKPRRAWLAAVMSLPIGPVGQIYAGRFRRSVFMWSVGALLLPILAFSAVSAPLGITGLTLLLFFYLSFPLYLSVDAFVLARYNHDAPLKRYQRLWVYCLAYLAFGIGNLAVSFAVQSFVAEAFAIPTRSMSPTIQAGDRVLVDKFWYGPSKCQRGDVVVFRSAGPDSELYVMRLVGLPGDEIEVADEKVLLNGAAWNDEHVFFDVDIHPYSDLANYGPIRVPPESFFVLGDNRRLSKDSRIIGSIPESDLYGKACMIYWSHERIFSDPHDTSRYEQGAIRWNRVGTRLD